MAGPTIKRKLLGIELRRLREAAGVTRPQAAAALKCSPGRIGHIEVGKNALGYAELVLLLRDLYGADDVTLAALEELRAEATKRGWWSTYGLPEWLAGYVGLEFDACSVRTLELELVPGLLQAPGYARLLHSYSRRLSAREVDRRVAARMQRQERLTGPDPLTLAAVISESALLRCARHPAVAAEQLALLADRAQWPNVELRVLPLDAGVHPGVSGAFTLLSFADRVLPDVAHQEYSVGGHLVDDQAVVSALDTLFGELRDLSLSVPDSKAVLSELAEHTR